MGYLPDRVDGHMSSTEQAEVNRRAQGAPEAWLRATIAFERVGALVESSLVLLDESRRLLAAIQARRADTLMGSSRALIDESRRLLVAVRGTNLPTTPGSRLPDHVAVRRSDGASVDPAVRHSDTTSVPHSALSVRVFDEGARFGWNLRSPSGEMLGQGTAETELKARTDAFGAGMTYIERLKRCSRPTDTSLH